MWFNLQHQLHGPISDPSQADKSPKSDNLQLAPALHFPAASAGHHDEGNHRGPHHHYQASQVGGGDGEGRGHGHVTGPGGSHCVAVCAQGRTAAGGCVEGTRLLWN
uniref:(northern house mosquito) hypothetical protein n=1 Tax=Culex pipiens TaxID=7175 RepID=A0A8D8CF95_CULPI